MRKLTLMTMPKHGACPLHKILHTLQTKNEHFETRSYTVKYLLKGSIKLLKKVACQSEKT